MKYTVLRFVLIIIAFVIYLGGFLVDMTLGYSDIGEFISDVINCAVPMILCLTVAHLVHCQQKRDDDSE